MRSLTANDAIRVWEAGQRQQPAERAVTVLSAAFPQESKEELRRLTLGRCNARLLEVRSQVFGPELNGFSECANCGERLEFTLNSEALRFAEPVEPPANEYDLECDGYGVRFRLLQIEDLNVAGQGDDLIVARNRLIERCILAARRGDQDVPVAKLPEAVIAHLGERLAELDSGAEVVIELSCPVCDSKYRLPFDVASFFHIEIDAQARRLLREVHTLARAYGWHEGEILAMSARRRQSYIEMLER
jgi:hypothetical protein